MKSRLKTRIGQQCAVGALASVGGCGLIMGPGVPLDVVQKAHHTQTAEKGTTVDQRLQTLRRESRSFSRKGKR